MDWQTLKQDKGKNVQEYTQEFRKRALILGIPLYKQETLLKYIGGLHDYLKHTILMLNLTNLDEVSVQAIHLELGRRNDHGSFFLESIQLKEGKNNKKEKFKRIAIVKKEKRTCTHGKKEGHDEDHCWILHPEMKTKKYANNGKNKTTTATIQQNLGSDSGDETIITPMGVRGISSIVSTSSSSPKSEIVDDKRNELFHIKVITKHVKIDTLVDS
jgi:hypothetical protein